MQDFNSEKKSVFSVFNDNENRISLFGRRHLDKHFLPLRRGKIFQQLTSRNNATLNIRFSARNSDSRNRYHSFSQIGHYPSINNSTMAVAGKSKKSLLEIMGKNVKNESRAGLYYSHGCVATSKTNAIKRKTMIIMQYKAQSVTEKRWSVKQQQVTPIYKFQLSTPMRRGVRFLLNGRSKPIQSLERRKQSIANNTLTISSNKTRNNNEVFHRTVLYSQLVKQNLNSTENTAIEDRSHSIDAKKQFTSSYRKRRSVLSKHVLIDRDTTLPNYNQDLAGL